MKSKPLVIAVVGPTASGKSELAVSIAKKFNGEIVSADSRQVYKDMDIGTGKVSGYIRAGAFYYKTIRHFGIDIASAKTQYSVAKFQKLAQRSIADITSRGKLPIICGGTGHWVDAAVFNQKLPSVIPNSRLRNQLSRKTTGELYSYLKQLDPRRAKTIDPNNSRRLIRALEIVLTTGKPVPLSVSTSPYDTLWIGINTDKEELDKKIERRLKQRLKMGMLKEVKRLRQRGVSWQRLENFGLEYKFCALVLQNKLSERELEPMLSRAIKQYSKRQLTWFKKNKDIIWISSTAQALKIVTTKTESRAGFDGARY